MTSISYAQHYEDAVLMQLFDGLNNGFYIDIGAQHPARDSVTCGFYRRGWRGINIEPVAQYSALLQRHRPRDIILECLIGSTFGSVPFYEIPRTGLSTVHKEFADQARRKGFVVTEKQILSTTLDAVCAAYAVREVHFLKIDVEGAEDAVLRGFSFDRIRPIILVIEATKPCSTEPNFSAWEPYVTGKGYLMVHDDGLNRFYLANEHRSTYGHHFVDNRSIRGDTVQSLRRGDLLPKRWPALPKRVWEAKAGIVEAVKARFH